jgi:hypothetical protein
MAGFGLSSLGAVVILFWLLANLAFLRRMRPASVHRSGHVVLILPLAGAPPGLPTLLRALAGQSLPPARLIVATEQGDEGAMRAAGSVPLPFPVEFVTAAPAAHRGQKCSNILAGLARLTAEEPVIVLLDADIRPPPWWLSTLASPVLDGTADLVTGYRWLQPGPGPASQLAAWLDRSVVALPRVRWMPVAWGGSLALGPAALAEGAAAAALERTLSDDLSLAEMAARRGLRVLTRRILLLPTPLEGGPGAVAGFVVRQHRILHLYRPALWWAGAAASQVMCLLWLWLVLAAPLWLPLLPAWGALRWTLHDRIARRLGEADPARTRLAQLLLAVSPVPDVLSAAFHWASLFPRRITWHHVTYDVTGPESVRVLRRAAP